MQFVKSIFVGLLLVSIGQAVPTVSSGSIKSLLETVKISVAVDNKYQTFSFSAEGVADPSGQVILALPKLVLDKKHFGIVANTKATAMIAEIACQKLGRKALVKNGALVTTPYIAIFDSIQVDVAGGNGILYFRGVVSSDKKMVLSSITCE